MVYIAVIGMFQKEAKLEKGELESMLAEIEIQKGAWNDVTMLNIVDLYEKALALVKKIQGHEVLNRELNAVPEPEEKRHKGGVESSSSSSFPPFVYH